MITIAFVGNCQMVSLCYFLQQLCKHKNYDIRWVSYSKEFNIHLGGWSDKCENKIVDDNVGIEFIKKCDYVFYQHIRKETSPFFHTENLFINKKPNAQFISISKIYVPLENYNESIIQLKIMDEKENNDIKVSSIIEKIKYPNIILINHFHPTTHLFLEIIQKMCVYLNIDFFNKDDYRTLLKDSNIMGLSS